MKIVVLLYSTGDVCIENNAPDDLDDGLDMEDYLVDVCGYHLDDMSWMAVGDEVKLYHCTDGEVTSSETL